MAAVYVGQSALQKVPSQYNLKHVKIICYVAFYCILTHVLQHDIILASNDSLFMLSWSAGECACV